jgi:trehalose/maltose transport system substrate-binding protein
LKSADARRGWVCLAAAATLVAAVVLSACGGSSGAPTIKFFVAIQPGGTIEANAERCTKEAHGRYTIKPELLPNDATQAREQLVRRLGAKDPSIDVIGLDVIRTGEFANAGWIEPWKGKLKQEATEEVFPSVIETATFDHQLYAAPFNTNTQVLWYRKDLVQKPPATWDEMIEQAEGLKEAGQIQVQAERYEGFMVWANALIDSAGTEILSGPETVDLEQKPTEEALAVMGTLANSSAASPNLPTSNEDTARLAFEAGEAAFMTNYTFAFASAKENAPEIAEEMGAAPFPRVNQHEARPPLGGFNLAVSSYSSHQQQAFEAARCLSDQKSQETAVELDGLPPSRSDLYESKTVKKAYPGFAGLVKEMVEQAGPRPATPAYEDVSSALQRTLHPPEKIDPEDTEGLYEELKSNLEAAVNREGLL